MRFLVRTCEYKDIVYRKVRGARSIETEFSCDLLFNGLGVGCIPLTRDGKYVFGVRGDFAMGGIHPVGLIGGSLNKDEMAVNNFDNVRAYGLKEIKEETALTVKLEELRFVGMGNMRNFCMFLFTAQLRTHSSKVSTLNRPGEFSCLVGMSDIEAKGTTQPMTEAFRFWRDHLGLVQSALGKNSPR